VYGGGTEKSNQRPVGETVGRKEREEEDKGGREKGMMKDREQHYWTCIWIGRGKGKGNGTVGRWGTSLEDGDRGGS